MRHDDPGAIDGGAGTPEGEPNLGRGVEADVELIHRAIVREQRDPEEGRERAPWYIWAAVVISLFWGGWYLGRHGGPFDTTTHVAFVGNPQTAPLVGADTGDVAGGPPPTVPVGDPLELGAQVYAQHCASCHQQTGLGLAGVFPPIIGSEWVTGSERRLVLILLNGMQGPIDVAGTTYNGAMPAWRDPFTDAQIAAVATYIRQWEANDASPVAPELVGELRAETEQFRAPWTVAELAAFLGGGG